MAWNKEKCNTKAETNEPRGEYKYLIKILFLISSCVLSWNRRDLLSFDLVCRIY